MKVNVRRVLVVEYSSDVEPDDLIAAMRDEREYVLTDGDVAALATHIGFEQTSIRVWLDAEGSQ